MKQLHLEHQLTVSHNQVVGALNILHDDVTGLRQLVDTQQQQQTRSNVESR